MYHFLTWVFHAVHVVTEEQTGSHKICTHCLPRRKTKTAFRAKQKEHVLLVIFP